MNKKTLPESEPLCVPYKSSRKKFIAGTIHPISVGYREITQDDDQPPIPVYDTSGAYTDPNAMISLEDGLPPLRGAMDEKAKGRPSGCPYPIGVCKKGRYYRRDGIHCLAGRL